MTTGAQPSGAPLTHLSARRPDSDDLNVIVETPKGSRNKFDYDEEYRLFALGGVLPAGAVFPYDFGFIPSTRGGDGDPLDVLVLLDTPVAMGCVLAVRLVGVIEAEQRERDGASVRNDRLLAVATHAHTHEHVHALADLRPRLLEEIEGFFAHYNRLRGKEFRPVGRGGPERARALLEQGILRHREGRAG